MVARMVNSVLKKLDRPCSVLKLLRIGCFLLLWKNETLWAYSANKVAFEFLDTGRYRVTVSYTVPALKEFRESYVIFKKKKDAEKFYWALIRGADFYPENPELLRFVEPKREPEPW